MMSLDWSLKQILFMAQGKKNSSSFSYFFTYLLIPIFSSPVSFIKSTHIDMYIHATRVETLLERLGEYPSAPYLFPSIISFIDGAQRKRFEVRDDLRNMDPVYSFLFFLNIAKGPKTTALALYNSWKDSWMGDMRGNAQTWHVWGLAIIHDPSPRGGSTFLSMIVMLPKCPKALKEVRTW